MLVQTLVHRRAEDLLARVDRFVVDQVLPQVGTDDPLASRLIEIVGPHLDALGKKLALVIEPAARSLHEQAEKLGESLRVPITHFATRVERLPARSPRSARGPTPSAGSATISRRSARRVSRFQRSRDTFPHREGARAMAVNRGAARRDEDGASFPTTSADAIRTMELIDSIYTAAGLPLRQPTPVA